MSRFPRALTDRFEPVRLLGSGGYGSVWLANQRALDRPVALKLLHGQALAEEELVARFLAEARVTAALVHPNVVILLDHNVEGGLPWIAYEYLPGPTLSARIEAGPLPLAQALTAALHVARALEAAHARGILHRDIKPDNVIEDGHGGFKVTDFGIARWVAASVQTASGVVLGTPAYIAPEQFLGRPPAPAVDLYALGIMLYEALVAQVPFRAEGLAELAHLHLHGPPPPPSQARPEVPPRVERLVLRLLAKEPDQRPESAGAVVAELEALIAGAEPVDPGRTIAGPVAGDSPRRRPSGVTRNLTARQYGLPRGQSGAVAVPAAPAAPAAGRRWLCGLALVALAMVGSLGTRARVAPPPAGAPAGPVEIALEELLGGLKREHMDRVALDRERMARELSPARTKAYAARVAAQRAALAELDRRAAALEQTLAPERLPPARRALPTFRMRICRWSIACWRARFAEGAPPPPAAGVPSPAQFEELIALADDLPDRLPGEDEPGGARAWAILAAADDLEFVGRHFAFGTPAERSPAELAALLPRTRAPGPARPARRWLAASFDMGRDGRVLLEPGRVEGAVQALGDLRDAAPASARSQYVAREDSLLEVAVEVLAQRMPPRTGEIEELRDKHADEAVRSAQSPLVRDLTADRAIATAILAALARTPPAPGRAVWRHQLRARTAGLAWFLDTILDWALRRPGSADPARAYRDALEDLARAADEPGLSGPALPALFYEARMIATIRVKLATPDPYVGEMISRLAALGRAPERRRASVLARLLGANLDLGRDTRRQRKVDEMIAQVSDLRELFASLPGAEAGRDNLLWNALPLSIPCVELNYYGDNNVSAAGKALVDANPAQVAVRVAPFLAAQRRTEQLCDMLHDALAGRPAPAPAYAGFFAHVEAARFQAWVCATRLQELSSWPGTEYLPMGNINALVEMFKPLDWSIARRYARDHALAMRVLLAASHGYDAALDAECGQALADLKIMSHIVELPAQRLTARIPTDVEAELRHAMLDTPDADPELGELFAAALFLAWHPEEREIGLTRLELARARAARWPAAVHRSLDFDLR